MRRGSLEEEQGYALILVIMFLAMAGLAISTSLQQEKTATRTVYTTTIRSQQYFGAEQAVNRGVSWLRENSTSLLSPFKGDVFYSRFDVTTPSIGDNDSSEFTIPTKIKVSGTNDSPILTNDASLGTANFASTGSFNAVTEFTGGNFGNMLVRVTLIDAIPINPAGDFGPPPAATPTTDFYPIFRVDAMVGTTEGAHVFATVTGDLQAGAAVGFHGEDFVEIRQSCDSYLSSTGSYGGANINSNCPVSTGDLAMVHQNEDIFGTLNALGSIDVNSPWGGDVCSDLSCTNPGEECEGGTCNVAPLPSFDDWATLCPSHGGNLTINSSQTLTPASGAAADRCWNSVTIRNNKTLTLDSTTVPYYFENLTFQNNNNSVLNIAPNDPNGTVTIFVRNLSGNGFRGNQMLNVANKPINFTINYLGNNNLLLNGNADMKGMLVAPYAGVSVQGNFDYYGGIIALNLTMTGNGDLHYDEALGGSAEPTDISFGVKEMMQFYR